ncbi:hypothetical protein LguiB_033353 [Lonicera macranthoides]
MATDGDGGEIERGRSAGMERCLRRLMGRERGDRVRLNWAVSYDEGRRGETARWRRFG